MSGYAHVRICESLGVKFPRATRLLIREVGLRRNNDSPTLPSGFNCCAEGLGTEVSRSLGQLETFPALSRMSAPGGKADVSAT